MKIITAAVAAVALAASTVAAFAGFTTGTITKVEWSLGTITLDNGSIFAIPPTLLATPAVANLLVVGNKVKVTFESKVVSALVKA
jgi:hypothetical protein